MGLADSFPKMSEKDFQQLVVDYARMTGWLVYHTYDSRRSEPGFPDLCMVRGERCVFVELKREGGKPTHQQQQWIDRLRKTPVECYVWMPSDWEGIKFVLRRATAKPAPAPA